MNAPQDLSASESLTPMFQQYSAIKQEHENALLFYRMGDFYELFFKDAEIAARELQIALTSRQPNAENPIPMCGVPFHAASSYISQLVEKGYTVAICEQLESPKLAKGLVKRGVIRVITPGTVVEETNLTAKEHTFLGALYINEKTETGAFAWLDYSTGFWTGLTVKKKNDLWQWVQKINPAELLLPDQQKIPSSVILAHTHKVYLPETPHFSFKQASERICKAQKVQDLSALGLSDKHELTCACGALLAYTAHSQKVEPEHLIPFKPLELSRYLLLDELTVKNLEIFQRLDGKKGFGTLWHEIDETLTPMGGRLLAERLHQPWGELTPIKDTADAVEWFVGNTTPLNALRQNIKHVFDLERLATRIFLNRALPKDFIALKNSLKTIPAVLKAVTTPATGQYATDDTSHHEDMPQMVHQLIKNWDNLTEYAQLLEKALADNPPTTITDGGLFKKGFNPQLDELLALSLDAEQLLNQLLVKEQGNLSTGKLKLGYNRVFGHYFELPKMAAKDAPEHFIRRQTLANAERFVTNELAVLEDKINHADEKRKELEHKLFLELRAQIAAARPRILFMSDVLAQLDFLQGLAHCAIKHAWTRPTLDTSTNLTIIQGRHPVIESILGSSNFIPNDVRMDSNRRLLLITGPNMAGKSTVLRQTSIITLLAQLGSFVPAKEAHIGLVDRIFSRVGASDNLAQGQSTFMVEMMETARILRQSSKNSLIILDEIGRGTSTYDGLALAWSVIEDLCGRKYPPIRTLFATHYHELTVLESQIAGVHTMNIAIREWNGEIIFLRKLVPGPADKSYGIEVARLAGVPNAVVQRARQILAQLEKDTPKHPVIEVSAQALPGFEIAPEAPAVQESLPPPPHPVVQNLLDLNPNTLTPIEALTILTDWKKLWGTAKEH